MTIVDQEVKISCKDEGIFHDNVIGESTINMSDIREKSSKWYTINYKGEMAA